MIHRQTLKRSQTSQCIWIYILQEGKVCIQDTCLSMEILFLFLVHLTAGDNQTDRQEAEPSCDGSIFNRAPQMLQLTAASDMCSCCCFRINGKIISASLYLKKAAMANMEKSINSYKKKAL